jgi:hypothetical protein
MVDRSRFNPTGGDNNDLKASEFLGKNLKLVIDRVDTVVYNQGEENENAKTVLYFEPQISY